MWPGPIPPQSNIRRRVPLPELAERGPVSLPARHGDEAGYDRHDQQAVEDAVPLPPAGVLASRDGRGGCDQPLKALRKPAVDTRDAENRVPPDPAGDEREPERRPRAAF